MKAQSQSYFRNRHHNSGARPLSYISAAGVPAAGVSAAGIPAAGLIAVFLAVSAGCSGTNLLVRKQANNVDEMYAQALEDLSDGLYPEAIKGFSEIKTKHPYTRFAPLADLGIADTNFKRGRWSEAIDGYRNFLKFNPKHERSPYCMLQIGEAYFQQLPTDWALAPPSEEKDQGQTRLAISAFRDAIARYPKHEITERAKEQLKACRKKLAEHELYVANFYLRKEVYKAAAARAQGVLRDYPGLGLDADALWIAGFAQVREGNTEKGALHLRRLQSKFPNNSNYSAAGAMLADIPAKKTEAQ